ncbi:Peptidoglycan-binding lysin domain protein [Cellulomonas flavigena DSM 20109]|uniref:Peptidoglycan-binding lysin domain protein n=1 Tax=Cellulomonas flavigena (strain ATCC 482 / DSM 20109 / BCRC 11376 / JCM 18109 / NBRC 3775 / NCIMB 8073 / NRS 134) TaxID=446466 RepID=D5UGW5_CELFN|nr:LysM domain-containing protein [Cellulomonas flavigena]ADG75213.1 Peptidoglycan-binding lysin domain protein [Cellulomonas flavigena DSM 20109]
MTDLPPPRPPRSPRPVAAAAGLVVAGAIALVVAGALGLWLADHVASTRLWRVEDVVGPLVVTAGVLAATWAGVSALVAGLCAAVRATGGAWRAGESAVQRWAPGLVRRALAVAVAAGVGLTGAAGAHATTLDAPSPAASVIVDLGWAPTQGDPLHVDAAPGVTPTASSAATPTATPTPDVEPAAALGAPAPTPDDRTTVGTAAPTTSAPAAVAPAVAGAATVPVSAPVPPPETAPPPTADAPVGTVEVRAGDSLWGLAARSLGPGATDAQIAAEWPRWYAANASTIGPDPDVLLPGQVLVVPTADGSAR